MLPAISAHSPNIPPPLTANQQKGAILAPFEKPQESTKTDTRNSFDQGSKKQGLNQQELSPEELAQIVKLKQRDAEVKAHEQAHLSAASGIATSGASFSYQKGPDGQRYAIGGEVQIDTSSIPGDPAATLRKAEIIKQAALAPGSPSSQDQKVASQANSMAAKARAELFAVTQEKTDPEKENEQQGSLFNQKT